MLSPFDGMTVPWNLKILDIVLAATNPSAGVGQAAEMLAIQMSHYNFRVSDFALESAQDADAAALPTLLTLVSTVWLVRRLARR